MDANYEDLVREIEKSIPDDFYENDDFEPTDTEGLEMEGPVFWNGRKYGVFLTAWDEDPWKLQAAKCIAEQIERRGDLIEKQNVKEQEPEPERD